MNPPVDEPQSSVCVRTAESWPGRYASVAFSCSEMGDIAVFAGGNYLKSELEISGTYRVPVEDHGFIGTRTAVIASVNWKF